MRTLVLIPDAFGGHGGIAKFNRDLLRALCAHPDCAEVVAIPRLIPNPMEPLPARLTYITSGLNSKLRYTAIVLKLVHTDRKFNLIVCGHINLLPIAYLLRFWVRAPIVLVIHGIEGWKPTNRWLTNYLVGKINAFISVSRLTKQRFIDWAKLNGTDGFLLPNAVDLKRYGSAPKSPALLARYGLFGKTVLMTLARLDSNERLKGIDEVLHLLPTLVREIPGVAYLIAGDGTDRPRLEKKAKLLGIDKHVVFAGFISEAEKADHYRLADAYIMPSRGEGFGIVFLEAMACGIPVVASKVDGSREAVRDGKLGILVSPDDPEEIKKGIIKALKRPKGLIPEGLDHFCYNNFEQRCHCIIDEVLTGRKEGVVS